MNTRYFEHQNATREECCEMPGAFNDDSQGCFSPYDMDQADTGIMTNPGDAEMSDEDVEWIKNNFPGFLLKKDQNISDEQWIRLYWKQQ